MKKRYIALYTFVVLHVYILFLSIKFFNTQWYLTLLYVQALLLSVITVLGISCNKKHILFTITYVVSSVTLMLKLANAISGFIRTPGDEGYDLSVVSIILNNHHLVYDTINKQNVAYSYQPLIHLASSTLLIVTGLDPAIVTYVVPILTAIFSYILFTIFLGDIALRGDSKYIATSIYFITFFNGYQGIFWRSFVRETYVLPYALLLFLSLIGVLNKPLRDVRYLIIISLSSIVVVIGHIATKYFLFFALLLWYAVLIIDRTIGETKHKRSYVLPILMFLIIASISYDIFQAFLAVGLTNWIRSIVNELTQYYVPRILQPTQALSEIGTKLIPFERYIVRFNYFTLLMYLFILLINTIDVSKNLNTKKVRRGLVGVILILFYFTALYGRFLPGQPRHALMRFSPWILLIFVLYIISKYRDALNTSNHKHHSIIKRSIILAISILMLIVTFLNIVAQNSPVLKYTMQLGDPRTVANFVESYFISSKFVLGYYTEKPYDPPSLWFSLVDSYLVRVKHEIHWFLPDASASMHNVLLVEGLRNPLIRFYLHQNAIYNDGIYSIFTQNH